MRRSVHLSNSVRHLVFRIAILAILFGVRGKEAFAQQRALTACTPDALAICAELQLGPANAGLFQIGVRTIGSATQPQLPVSLYNLIFGTGSSGSLNPVSTLLAPLGVGGATISDASDWEIFDTGELLFLSALSNRGVGGCVNGADVDGFGQAVRTCGAGQLAMFSFMPTAMFDASLFSILNFEAVALTDPAQGASCGDPSSACAIIADTQNPPTVTPEPLSIALVGSGLLFIAICMRRRHEGA